MAEQAPLVDRVFTDVWRIRLPLPFRLREINLYLIEDGADFALFDCGIDTPAARQVFDDALRGLGVAPERITRVFASHMHPDHIGMAGRHARSGARVFLMPEEERRTRYVWSDRPLSGWSAYFARHGLPGPAASDVVEATERLRPAVSLPESFDYVRDHEFVRIGARTMRVAWAPGHSDFLYLLIDDDRGVVFASDQLLPSITPNIGLYAECRPNPLRDYLWSLGRFEREQGYRILPAHGEPYATLSTRIAELRSHHAERLRGVEEAVRTAGPSGATAHEIVQRFWPDGLSPHELRFAMVEVIAHAAYLNELGKLRAVERDRSIRYVSGG